MAQEGQSHKLNEESKTPAALQGGGFHKTATGFLSFIYRLKQFSCYTPRVNLPPRIVHKFIVNFALLLPNHPPSLHGNFASRDGGHASRVKLVLCRVDALVERFRGVIVQHRDGLLANDRP